jgi:hypothetical protein
MHTTFDRTVLLSSSSSRPASSSSSSSSTVSSLSNNTMLSTFLNGLLLEHGCSHYDEIVMDRAGCIKKQNFDSRHLSCSSDANGNILLGGLSLSLSLPSSSSSSHSTTRWESSEPSITTTTILHNTPNNSSSTRLALVDKGNSLINGKPRLIPWNYSNTVSIAAFTKTPTAFSTTTTAKTVLQQHSGIPSCPIRKLSCESSLSSCGNGEEESYRYQQRGIVGGIGTRTRTCNTYSSIVSPTTTTTYPPSSTHSTSPLSVASSSSSSPLVPTRPPLSPKKKMMFIKKKHPSPSAIAVTDSTKTKSYPMTNGGGRNKIMMIRKPTVGGQHVKNKNQPNNVRPTNVRHAVVKFPSSSTYASQKGPYVESHRLPSTSPFVFHELDTIQERQSSLLEQSESIGNNNRTSSSTSAITDFQGPLLPPPNSNSSNNNTAITTNTTIRSLSKTTLGVDFHEDAPVQPLRRPSAEPDDQPYFPRSSKSFSSSSFSSSSTTSYSNKMISTQNHTPKTNHPIIVASSQPGTEKELVLPLFPLQLPTDQPPISSVVTHFARRQESQQQQQQKQQHQRLSTSLEESSSTSIPFSSSSSSSSSLSTPRFDFQPYPLDHYASTRTTTACTKSALSCWSTTSTPSNVTAAAAAIAVRSDVTTLQPSAVVNKSSLTLNDEFHIATALFPLENTNDTVTTQQQYQRPVSSTRVSKLDSFLQQEEQSLFRDIVFQPVGSCSSRTATTNDSWNTTPTATVSPIRMFPSPPLPSSHAADIAFQYPPSIVLEKQHPQQHIYCICNQNNDNTIEKNTNFAAATAESGIVPSSSTSKIASHTTAGRAGGGQKRSNRLSTKQQQQRR